MQSSLTGSGMTSPRVRERMVQRLREQGIRDERVLEVMLATPRHIFVEEAFASRAYDDNALPIGLGQFISQPYIVARMTELLLQHTPLQRVLEIGTGSGYQLAVLAQLIPTVYSLERIYPLQQRARRCLQSLQLRNVLMRYSDGMEGWAQHAPYDAILLTAAPLEVPAVLLEQLAPGGCLLAPVGEAGAQKLFRITRLEEGFRSETLETVSFVPLLPGTQ